MWLLAPIPNRVSRLRAGGGCNAGIAGAMGLAGELDGRCDDTLRGLQSLPVRLTPVECGLLRRRIASTMRIQWPLQAGEGA